MSQKRGTGTSQKFVSLVTMNFKGPVSTIKEEESSSIKSPMTSKNDIQIKSGGDVSKIAEGNQETEHVFASTLQSIGEKLNNDARKNNQLPNINEISPIKMGNKLNPTKSLKELRNAKVVMTEPSERDPITAYYNKDSPQVKGFHVKNSMSLQTNSGSQVVLHKLWKNGKQFLPTSLEKFSKLTTPISLISTSRPSFPDSERSSLKTKDFSLKDKNKQKLLSNEFPPKNSDFYNMNGSIKRLERHYKASQNLSATPSARVNSSSKEKKKASDKTPKINHMLKASKTKIQTIYIDDNGINSLRRSSPRIMKGRSSPNLAFGDLPELLNSSRTLNSRQNIGTTQDGVPDELKLTLKSEMLSSKVHKKRTGSMETKEDPLKLFNSNYPMYNYKK